MNQPMHVGGRWLLIAVSAVFLSWNVQRAIRGVTFDADQTFAYALTLPAITPGNSASTANEVRVRYVVADGRLLRPAELQQSGSWDGTSTLVHRADVQAATLRFRGRRVTLGLETSAASGVVHIEGDAGKMWDVDLLRPEGEGNGIKLLDLAGGNLVAERTSEGDEDDRLRTALTLAPLLLVVLLLRPWRTSAAFETWAIFHVSVLHLLTWFTQGIGVNSDTTGYVDGISALAAGQVAYFPPGYPLFLALWSPLLPPSTGLVVTFVQHALTVLTLVGLQRVVRAFLSRDLASFGLLLAGSAAPILFLPQTILSENVALFGMGGVLWLASRRESAGTVGRDLMAGAAAGWAALARIIPLMTLTVPVLLVVGVTERSRHSWLRSARILGTAVALMFFTAAWLWLNSGIFGVSDSEGLHMYNRVVTEQFLLDGTGPATRRFLGLVGDRPLRGVPHWEVIPVLQERGLEWIAAERLMGRVAWEGLRINPWQFAVHSFDMAWREYRATPLLPQWATNNDPLPQLENEPLLGVRSSSILWRQNLDHLFGAVWPYLLWAPLAGFLLLPWLDGDRTIFLACLAVPVGYLLTSSVAEYFLERYVVCVLPFALILAPTPLAAVASMWRRRRAEIIG